LPHLRPNIEFAAEFDREIAAGRRTYRERLVNYRIFATLAGLLSALAGFGAEAQSSYVLQDGINRAPTAALVVPNSNGVAAPPSTSNPLVVGAMTQAVTFTSCGATIAATNVPQLLVAANPTRHYLVIDNSSTTQLTVGLNQSVTATNGLPIYANGGGYEWAAAVPTNALYIVGTAGSLFVCWQG
jgi:hypothetical protein